MMDARKSHIKKSITIILRGVPLKYGCFKKYIIIPITVVEIKDAFTILKKSYNPTYFHVILYKLKIQNITIFTTKNKGSNFLNSGRYLIGKEKTNQNKKAI